MFESLIDLLRTTSDGYAYALAVTFLAGVLASAICPCTVPVGLGVASIAGTSETEQRRSGGAIALAFFCGIVISLTVLGALAGQLGALATEAFGRGWALAMAAVSFAAAMWALFTPPVEFAHVKAWRRPGFLGAFVYGLIFSVGTSVAPLLLLVSVAAGASTLVGGIAFAFVFGLGRGAPFLVAGLAGSAVTRIPGFGAWNRGLHVFSGIILLIVSAYYARVYLAFA